MFPMKNRFDDKVGQEDALSMIGSEFLRRLQSNMQFFCPTCERIVPVFNNLQSYQQQQSSDDGSSSSSSSSSGNRRLLQASSPSSVPGVSRDGSSDSNRKLLQSSSVPGVIAGTYSVMLVYKFSNGTDAATISLADVQRAVYSPTVGTSWELTVDPASISKYVDALQNNQFIIGTLQVMESPLASQ